MQTAGTLKDADITVVMTGDEEKRGAPLVVDRKDLIDAGHAADVALEFEGLARSGGKAELWSRTGDDAAGSAIRGFDTTGMV